MTTMNKYRVSILHNFTNFQLKIMFFLTIILALLNTKTQVDLNKILGIKLHIF